MTRKMTADLRVAITPELRGRLESEAKRKRRSLSSLARVLLERALVTSEQTPDPPRNEFGIRLTQKEVRRLEKRGYELIPVDGDGRE